MRSFFVFLVLFLVSCYASVDRTWLFPSPNTNSPWISQQTRPLILSHRGSKVFCVENSILCHKTALALGTDVLEFDIRVTADDKLVVFHDPSIERVTNGLGMIELFTLAEIQAFELGYKFTADNGTSFPYRGHGIQIPTLDQFLDALPESIYGRPVLLNVEIKQTGKPGRRASELLWEEIKTRNLYNRINVASSHCSSLKYFRQISEGKITTSACENEAIVFFFLSVTRLARLWYPSGVPYQAFQIPTHSSFIHLDTPSFIASAHSFGLKVQFWVVNQKREMIDLLENGADAIITDRTDRAFEVFQKYGWKSDKDRVMTDAQYHEPLLDAGDEHTCVTILCKLISLFSSPSFVLALCLTIVGTFFWTRMKHAPYRLKRSKSIQSMEDISRLNR